METHNAGRVTKKRNVRFYSQVDKKYTVQAIFALGMKKGLQSITVY